MGLGQPIALKKAKVLWFLAWLQGHGLVAGWDTHRHVNTLFQEILFRPRPPHRPFCSQGNFDLGPSPGQGSDQALSFFHRVSKPAKAAPSDARPGPGI